MEEYPGQNSKYKSPETEACLVCLRNSKKASVIRALGTTQGGRSAAKQGEPLAKDMFPLLRWSLVPSDALSGRDMEEFWNSVMTVKMKRQN